MKKPVLIFMLHIFVCSVHSYAQQSPRIIWQNTIGGNHFDILKSLEPAADGGYILGGESRSGISGDKTENTNGIEDYWIVKTNGVGNIQWQNTIGGSNEEVFVSALQTTDGGYMLGGYSKSNISGDKTENCIGGYDYWIVKTDAAGIIQWQNTIGGSADDKLCSIRQTSDGGYILGGTSFSDISGDKTENRIGTAWEDYWIVKTDAAGNIQWQNTIGGFDKDLLNCVVQTADGGYILGGSSLSNISGDKTENMIGGNFTDYWLVKTDAAGNIQWQNTIGGNDTDDLIDVKQTPDGGYILGGNSISNISGDKIENSNGFNDFWIIKTDGSGNIQWQNTIGGNYHEGFQSLEISFDGNYIVGGTSYSGISGDKTDSCRGQEDFWLIVADANGIIRWQKTIGGTGSDGLQCVRQSMNGSYMLGGYSLSGISGDKTEICIGYHDYWFMEISNEFNLISGTIFFDQNSNSVQDAGELTFAHRIVTEGLNGHFAFSNQNGKYTVVVPDTGNYSVSSSSVGYLTAVPATQNAHFPGFQQEDSLNDFGHQPSSVINDLCVTLSRLGNFRPNFNADYRINYSNVGTTVITPTIILFPDSALTFNSANPAASSITPDSVVWNLGPLAPFQTGIILVSVHVALGTPVGAPVHSMVRIEPLAGDTNPSCNTAYNNVLITSSVDPNEITVDRDSVLVTELSNPGFLDYTIYFQNTGTDTAFNVKILNPVDTSRLELSSFEFISSSHPCNLSYRYWDCNLQYMFENILLPDSNIDEQSSHGFIRYRIKPGTALSAGDSICNTAFIYFDYNNPVQTNIAVTEIVLPVGISAPGSSLHEALLLYPNPAGKEIIVQSGKFKVQRVEVFDLLGQLQTSNFKLQTNSMDVSKLAPGIYFVKVRGEKEEQVGKFVKE